MIWRIQQLDEAHKRSIQPSQQSGILRCTQSGLANGRSIVEVFLNKVGVAVTVTGQDHVRTVECPVASDSHLFRL